MSAVTDRLSEANLRELARLIRQTHARRSARLERERLAAQADAAQDHPDGSRDDSAAP